MSFETTAPPQPIVWDNATLTRFWAYQSQFPENYFSFQKGADVVRHVRRYLPGAARVVDYGCGPGSLLPHLLDAGYRVTGADISLETIGAAARNLTSLPYFEGLSTIDDLVSRNQTFDGVFLLEVVEHLNDEWLDRTLANAARLLKPKGVLIVTTPNEEHLQDSFVYCPVSNVLFHRWQHVRSWSAKTLGDALRQHGFDLRSVETRNFRNQSPSRVSLLRRIASRVMSRWREPQSLLAIASR